LREESLNTFPHHFWEMAGQLRRMPQNFFAQSDRDGFKTSWPVSRCWDLTVCLSCGIVTPPNQTSAALQCADAVFVRSWGNAPIFKPTRDVTL